tara:strand:- start:14305 stop:14508 length:204 start_codon:yes stop_codon:yes gene_type:complete
MDQKKISYVSKNINIIDKEKKEHICKILLTYNVNLTQNNNGVYCYYSDLNPDILDIIYNYIMKALEK